MDTGEVTELRSAAQAFAAICEPDGYAYDAAKPVEERGSVELWFSRGHFAQGFHRAYERLLLALEAPDDRQKT